MESKISKEKLVSANVLKALRLPAVVAAVGLGVFAVTRDRAITPVPLPPTVSGVTTNQYGEFRWTSLPSTSGVTLSILKPTYNGMNSRSNKPRDYLTKGDSIVFTVDMVEQQRGSATKALLLKRAYEFDVRLVGDNGLAIPRIRHYADFGTKFDALTEAGPGQLRYHRGRGFGPAKQLSIGSSLVFGSDYGVNPQYSLNDIFDMSRAPSNCFLFVRHQLVLMGETIPRKSDWVCVPVRNKWIEEPVFKGL